MEIQRYQKLIPVGRLVSQGQIYWLIEAEPRESSHRWVDNLGCYEFMVVPSEPMTDEFNKPVKSGHNPVYPSPRPIVVTSFLIEWGNEGQHIIAMPTEEYEVA